MLPQSPRLSVHSQSLWKRKKIGGKKLVLAGEQKKKKKKKKDEKNDTEQSWVDKLRSG